MPSVIRGNDSEKAYGTLEIAEIPAPESSIRTTPKLLMRTTIKRASSPRQIGRVSFWFFVFICVCLLLVDVSVKCRTVIIVARGWGMCKREFFAVLCPKKVAGDRLTSEKM